MSLVEDILKNKEVEIKLGKISLKKEVVDYLEELSSELGVEKEVIIKSILENFNYQKELKNVKKLKEKLEKSDENFDENSKENV